MLLKLVAKLNSVVTVLLLFSGLSFVLSFLCLGSRLLNVGLVINPNITIFSVLKHFYETQTLALVVKRSHILLDITPL